MLLNRHRKTKVEDVNVGDLENQANTTKRLQKHQNKLRKLKRVISNDGYFIY